MLLHGRTVGISAAGELHLVEQVSPINLGIEDPDTAFDPPCASTAFAAGKCSISSGRSLRQVALYQIARKWCREAHRMTVYGQERQPAYRAESPP